MRYLRAALLLALTAAPAAAQDPDATRPLWAGRPDAAALTRDTDARLSAARARVDSLLARKGRRTIANTLVPYERVLRGLELASNRGNAASELHPDSAVRSAGERAEQKVQELRTELGLSRPLYDAIAAVDLAGADAETRYWVAKRLKQFRLSGVDRPEEVRTAIAALRDTADALEQTFSRNLRDDVDTVYATKAELEGLPTDYVARHPAGLDGRIALTTTYPDVNPLLSFARSDDVRRRMLVAFNNRAWPANGPVLDSILRVRQRIAGLLGRANWAEVATADKMIETATNASAFIDRVVAASARSAADDYAALLERKRRDTPGATAVEPWEQSYWAQVVRKETYDFDAEAVRAYFPYDSVKRGILNLAATIFDVRFRPARGVPVWHPSVEAWEMLDHGKVAGRFYLDMHPRPGKFSHAAVFPFRVGTRDGDMPEGVLVANVPGGQAGDPGLMEYGDVRTFLHELGHLVHLLSARHARWVGLGPFGLEFDFVEAPSQMLEEWLWDPKTLASFARHYQTGEPIPADLVRRMKEGNDFGKGLNVRRQMTYARISLALHDHPPAGLDPDSLVRAVESEYLPFPPMTSTHIQASFGHLTGYTSNYYTYMWSLVIAKDLFSGFDKGRLLRRGVARRYRNTVLAPGGSAPAAKLIENFLGRPFNFAAWQAWLDERPPAAASAAAPAGN
ncbi:MAG TPA: M3 family metallopeptidase [Gemmatimonadales bacterium]|nr:M3 family metallopeptidase [Gemmatimonadales bacterium]